MTEPELTVDRGDDGVAVITLSRPKAMNAIDRGLLEALVPALQDVVGDPEIRAVLLTGADGNFCVGADLKSALSEAQSLDFDARVARFHEIISAIVHAPKPFVAAVDGAAVSFGADIALACDLRVMSSRAYLQEKFVRIGLMPDGGGTFWLPRLVGNGRALEFLLLGTRIDAAQARDLGLANRVVEPEQVLETARSLAAELAAAPPLAVARIKAAVRDAWGGTIDDVLAREHAGQVELLGSSDVAEGVAAWMQRRAPTFRGR